MELPTVDCPVCRTRVVAYRKVGEGADPLTAPLQVHCVDCDERLDRFGSDPDESKVAWNGLTKLGYLDLDRPKPVGPGGCIETRGCEGCAKIDTRPW